MGQTASLASGTGHVDTPIAKEIKDFVLKVSGIAFALGISFFIINFVKTEDFVGSVIFLIGIIVANVPEGLLATVTVSLTLTTKKMAKKHVLASFFFFFVFCFCLFFFGFLGLAQNN